MSLRRSCAIHWLRTEQSKQYIALSKVRSSSHPAALGYPGRSHSRHQLSGCTMERKPAIRRAGITGTCVCKLVHFERLCFRQSCVAQRILVRCHRSHYRPAATCECPQGTGGAGFEILSSTFRHRCRREGRCDCASVGRVSREFEPERDEDLTD